MKTLFILTKDGEVVQVDPDKVYPTHPFQYIRVDNDKGISSEDVEVTGESREAIINYMKRKSEEEKLRIIMGSTSRLAELNVLTYLKTFLDYILEKEIKVGPNSMRKLNGQEIFEALKVFIDGTIEQLEKETKK